ncbi:Ankyrin repeat-containing protein family [Quillaja saponaria]|uniref:Ankyrin repeat-containing protein family n=1 Tax=Quillaja saponaria TaxID=32244 RepID=A0AAD7PW97_QUISA|nr:Ankyrin repeat-containing protein family [Quillaja saponaria]KAJ7969106.1 Ankyrin repeat-containing protein family [Quillaja saponaria]
MGTNYIVSGGVVLEVLRKDNYENWSVLVKNYLLSKDIWDIVEDPQDPPRPEDLNFKIWRKKNAKALHAIQISCGAEILSRLRGIASARKAWNTLAMTFGPKLRVNLDIEQGMADNSLVQYMPLHKNVERGDWNAVKTFIDMQPKAIFATTSSGKTALHIAVIAGHLHIVEALAKIMPKQLLEVRDADGYTALALAAALTGITEMAKCMVGRNEALLSIKTKDNMIPVVLASAKGHKDMTRYLYQVTRSEVLSEDNGNNNSLLLTRCITAEIFDVALDLLKHHPQLSIALDFDGLRPLYALARVPSAFPSGVQLAFWQRWIYHCVKIKLQVRGERSDRTVAGQLWGMLLNSILLRPLEIEEIYEQKLTHFQALEILNGMCKRISTFDESQLREASVYEAMLEATKHGITEFIKSMTQANTDLFWVVDENLRGIFSHAILHRREKIFNLIYGLNGRREVITSGIDSFGNNMLHLAGMLAPPSELDRKSGAALQMQRELHWFKAVESIVHPKCKEALNLDGMKPRELFTKNHEDLVRDGEKWAKETATSFTVVGTLITTIMFAVAFTVPGGNNQDTGIPIFVHDKMFSVFIVADAISLFAASTSVLIFLGILTSRYAEDDFLKALPTKLLAGLVTLFLSVVTMMIVFCAAISIMLQGHSQIVIVAISLGSVPVIIFVPLQFRLFAVIFNSTYRSEIYSNKKMKIWR